MKYLSLITILLSCAGCCCCCGPPVGTPPPPPQPPKSNLRLSTDTAWLLGRWSQIDSVSGDSAAIWTFTEDGKYSFDFWPDHQGPELVDLDKEGTWQLFVDNTLSLSPNPKNGMRFATNHYEVLEHTEKRFTMHRGENTYELERIDEDENGNE